MDSYKPTLSYRDSDGVDRNIEGVNLTLDRAGRHWIWSEQLQQNLAYKIKGREDALLASIRSLLFTIELRDKRIAALQRIADLAYKFASEVSPDEPE